MRVLITGGAGFIGSHTADALLKKGYEVRLLDNLSEPVHHNKKPLYVPDGAELVIGDVTSKNDISKALEGVDYVYHFAAYQDYMTDFSRYFLTNSVGTALLYEVIVEKKIKVKKIIVASSQAVYGEGKYYCQKDKVVYPPIRSLKQLTLSDWEVKCPVCGNEITPLDTDEENVNPQNQYAISKYSQEMIALNLGKRYEIPTTALRYSIVQGARQSLYNAYSGACRIFCLSVFYNKDIHIYEDGNQIRDFVNIKDVVAANLMMLDSIPQTDYKVFNVGGGRRYTVKEFAEIVIKVSGKKVKPLLTGEFRFGDTRHISSDISALKSLGWQPQYTPENSVEEYLDWLKTQNSDQSILEYAIKNMRNLGVVRKSAKSL